MGNYNLLCHIECETDNRGVMCAYAVDSEGNVLAAGEAGQTGTPQEAIKILKKFFKERYPECRLLEEDDKENKYCPYCACDYHLPDECKNCTCGKGNTK